MTQRAVEGIVGKLLTDDAFRERFERDRANLLDQLCADGIELSPVEKQALLSIPTSLLNRMATNLDPRIRKMDLREG